MQSLIDLQKKLVPDLLEVLQKRYDILHSIRLAQPIGRRPLAQSLGLTERTLRAEADFLKEQDLLDYRTSGMILTESGVAVLEELQELIGAMKGINTMQEKIKRRFGLDEVIIVHGDSDESPWTKKELGKYCANSIKSRLQVKDIIAVTGGTTTLEAAAAMTADFAAGKDITFVPARGGLGEDISHQANAIAAKMAEKTGATHKVLYAPDQISPEIQASMLQEPSIKEVLKLIKSPSIVVHGIGEAFKMARRRDTPDAVIEQMKSEQAAGEAFGYYFDMDGRVVHRVPTIGLQLKDLAQSREVIAVAGGKSKGQAIRSYLKGAVKTTVLITDEAAAGQLIDEND